MRENAQVIVSKGGGVIRRNVGGKKEIGRLRASGRGEGVFKRWKEKERGAR